uniref:Uncharacterized protein n=1 Tax=Globisporangium ultimum (strain ATCC 200006 / CBS 805.95 / DAOM BR144) TaxID=431595 RepID=K3WZ88_GLOUD
MPESPSPPAMESSPMDVDSTTPSTSLPRTVRDAPSRHVHDHGVNHHGAVPPSRPLLSVFDWDDTLCPSFWLYRNGFLASHGLVHGHESELKAHNAIALSERDRVRFSHFEDQVLRVLQLAMQMGPVFIITAATLQWVDACAANFLPRVQALLKQKADKVHVVSAREWYQQHNCHHQGDAMAWKTATFDALCAHLQLEKVSRRLQHRIDFVSVGDSVFERDACRQIEKKAPAIVHSKTLKFVEHPSLQELLDQVTLTISIYDRIRNHGGSLDLHITRNTNRQKGDPTLRLLHVDLEKAQHHQHQAAAISYIEQARAIHRMPNYMGAKRSTGTTIRI